MQVLYDFSNLYQSHSIFSTFEISNQFFEFHKLKEWWKVLAKEDKLLACQIEQPEIIKDFAGATTDAMVLFQVNRNYKQKDFIASKKYSESLSNTEYQEYKFNFIGKELMAENIAQFFSSFMLRVEKTSKSNKNKDSIKENNSSNQILLFTVKDESLDLVVEMLEAVISEFGKGEKLLFNKEEYGRIYPILTDYSFNKILAFKRIESSLIQKFLYKMMSLSILIENNLYRLYKEHLELSLEKESLISLNVNPNPYTLNDKSEANILDSHAKSPVKEENESEKKPKSAELETTKSSSSDHSVQNQFHSQTPLDSTSLPFRSTKDLSNGENAFFTDPSNIFHPKNLTEDSSLSAREGLDNYGEKLYENLISAHEQMIEYEEFINRNDYQGFQIGNLDINFELIDFFMTKFLDEVEDVELLKKEIKKHQVEALELQNSRSNGSYGYAESDVSHLGSRSINEVIDTSNEFFKTERRRPYGSYGSRTSPRKLYREKGYWRNGDMNVGYVKGRGSSKDSFSSYEDSNDYMSNGYYSNEYKQKKNYGRGYTKTAKHVYYLPKEK